MKLKNLIIFTFLLCFGLIVQSDAQSSIRFSESNVKRGLQRAKKENKFLFVDTYASWCIPCKKMKKVFRNREVANYFNSNYINIQINMDGPHGRTTYNDYDVVFLPTMMIFDREGRIKYKTDKLLTAQELLNIGIQANVEGVYLGNNASQIISTPFQNTVSTPKPKAVPTEIAVAAKKKKEQVDVSKREPEVDPNSEGQIVQVLGANDVMPPEVLYQEAYFSMQRMDDSHGDAAIAYLKTQENWSTEKNVKFIYDFVETTNSMLFDYISENRSHVASIVGEAQLSHSLDILVNQRIYQGYPRPDLDEAIELYNLVDTLTAEQRAYQYYLVRMQQEEDKNSYLSTVDQYLTTVAPTDHNMIHNAVEVFLSMDYEKQVWKKYKNQLERAIDLSPNKARYHVTLAKLYLMKDDRKRAKEAIENAMEIMNENAGDLNGEITDILNKIGKS